MGIIKLKSYINYKKWSTSKWKLIFKYFYIKIEYDIDQYDIIINILLLGIIYISVHQ